MTFDVILLSYSKTPEHRAITEDCIKSLKKAKNKVKVNIIVLESYEEQNFKGVKNVFFKENKFCYNQSMNEGFKHTSAPFVFFCNNDLIFSHGWADNCYQAFAMGYKSVSPYCPIASKRFTKSGDFLQVGYQVGFHITGWCIGIERETFKELGGFNTAVDFWYSDNIYAEQLKVANIKHALVCNATVKHLDWGSKTLNSLKKVEKTYLTKGQALKYKKEVRRLWDAKGKAVLHKH